MKQTIELLNYEGPVLRANKREKGKNTVFEIVDQWNIVIEEFDMAKFLRFIDGQISVKDSKGKEWMYTTASEEAKCPPDVLINFIVK